MEKVAVRKRGRQPKNQEQSQDELLNSKSKITDPVLEPFYIIKDSYNFTVMEVITPERGFGSGDVVKKDKIQVVGYFTKFQNALNCIAKEKFYKDKSEYHSIKEYMKTWVDLKNGINELLNSIEI